MTTRKPKGYKVYPRKPLKSYVKRAIRKIVPKRSTRKRKVTLS